MLYMQIRMDGILCCAPFFLMEHNIISGKEVLVINTEIIILIYMT